MGGVDTETLSKMIDYMVDLYFDDGHVVRAKLLDVKPSPNFPDADPEIMYEIIQVFEDGAQAPAWKDHGHVALEDPRSLAQAVPVLGPLPAINANRIDWVAVLTFPVSKVPRAVLTALRRLVGRGSEGRSGG